MEPYESEEGMETLDSYLFTFYQQSLQAGALILKEEGEQLSLLPPEFAFVLLVRAAMAAMDRFVLKKPVQETQKIRVLLTQEKNDTHLTVFCKRFFDLWKEGRLTLDFFPYSCKTVEDGIQNSKEGGTWNQLT